MLSSFCGFVGSNRDSNSESGPNCIRVLSSTRGHFGPNSPLSFPTRLIAAENSSARVEVDLFDGQVPVRVEDLEAALLFFLVGFLVVIELLDDRRAVEIVVGDGGVLENNRHAIIPAAVFRHVIPRR